MTVAANSEETTGERKPPASRVVTQEQLLANLQTPEVASDPAPEESSDAQKDKEPEKHKPTAQDRIRAAIERRNAAEAARDAAEKRAAELEAKLAAQAQTQAAPMEAADKPIRGRFASDDEYIEALAEWKAKDAIAKRELEQARAREQREAQEVAANWEKRQAQVMKEIPDYAEVLQASEIEIPKHIYAMLLESDHGPEVAYYLALNPDEAKSLASLNPQKAMRKLIAIEAEISSDKTDPAKTEEADKPATPKTTKAPPPIQPIRGVPAQNTGSQSDNFAQYRARRQAQMKR